jgi:hypothetical protein
MAHAYKPNYSEAKIGGSQCEASVDKKKKKQLTRSHLHREGQRQWCAFHPSYSRKPKIGELRSRTAWAKSKTLISKITRAQRAGDMAQAVYSIYLRSDEP